MGLFYEAVSQDEFNLVSGGFVGMSDNGDSVYQYYKQRNPEIAEENPYKRQLEKSHYKGDWCLRCRENPVGLENVLCKTCREEIGKDSALHREETATLEVESEKRYGVVCSGCGNTVPDLREENFINEYTVKCNTCLKGDMVNSPPHYTQGGIETIDFLQAKLGDEGFEKYCLGNVIKYVTRYEHKDQPLKDLQKAKFYLEKVIEIYEKYRMDT